jgi:hypothetical protein
MDLSTIELDPNSTREIAEIKMQRVRSHPREAKLEKVPPCGFL